MNTAENAEEFGLMRDIDFYKKDKSSESSCDDILFSIINWLDHMDEEIKKQEINAREIFDAKTQGYAPNTIGFSDRIKEYFNLGFDLETLCDICVLSVQNVVVEYRFV